MIRAIFAGAAAMLGLLVPLIFALVYLCWIKTDGDWKWRWGPDQ